jgi:hypothetical protein
MRLGFLAVVVASLVLPSLASAAGIGNPASLVGRENYGFTAEVENQKKEIEGDPMQSRRYLGKIIWGATDRLDLYARLGASDLTVRAPGTPIFRGSDGMTYGGGVTLRFADMAQPSITGLFNVQALSYYSRGEIVVPRTYHDESWIEKFDNRYRWSEIQFSILAAWNRETWQPYLGFSVTNAFGNVRKDMYRMTDGAYDFQTTETTKFSESAIPELVLGMDVGVGGTGKLSGELRIDDKNVSFVVGLSELYR